MLVLGVILLILGFLLSVPILWTLGVILIIVGAVLWLAEGAGASLGPTLVLTPVLASGSGADARYEQVDGLGSSA